MNTENDTNVDPRDLVEKETTMDPRGLVEAICERLRWTTSACNVFCCDRDLDNIHVEALSGVEAQLRSAKELAEELSHWVYKNAPNRARDYTLGAHRSAVERELFDQMLELPTECVDNAFKCWLTVTSAEEPIKTEALELVEKDGHIGYVQNFVHFRKEGHLQAANGQDATEAEQH